MIQRIQSIYLALVAILCIAFLFVPSVEINDVYILAKNQIMLLIGSLLIAAIAVGSIFLFKNRPLQINLGYLNLLLIAVLIGIAGYTEFSDGDFQPTIGAALPLLFLIFNLLAISGVKKDEKLVRSTDRLR